MLVIQTLSSRSEEKEAMQLLKNPEKMADIEAQLAAQRKKAVDFTSETARAAAEKRWSMRDEKIASGKGRLNKFQKGELGTKLEEAEKIALASQDVKKNNNGFDDWLKAIHSILYCKTKV
jgi:hypothetical protein